MPRGGKRTGSGRSITTVKLPLQTAKMLRSFFEREKLAYTPQNVDMFVNRILTNILEREQ